VAVCGVVVEAEGVRDDGGWGLEDELPERGNAASGAGKARAGDEFAEGGGVQWLVGAAAGEQPSGVRVGRGAHVRALIAQAQDEDGERFRARGWAVRRSGS
jgi:hypothetical protein